MCTGGIIIPSVVTTKTWDNVIEFRLNFTKFLTDWDHHTTQDVGISILKDMKMQSLFKWYL